MVALLAVSLLALILRLVLANQSFWLDEGASLVLARLPLSTYWSAAAGDFHPPLFYLLLRFWLPLAGNAEWLLRLPNIVFGAASIPVFYFLLKSLDLPKKALLFGALLLALNPLHIYYSQELRMYALNAFLTLLSWLFLVRTQKKRFFLVSLLNLYTFYGALLNLFVQLVYLFWRRRLRSHLIWFGFLLFAFLPWLPTFLAQLQGGGYLTRALPGWSNLSGALSLKALALIPLKFALGRVSFADKNLYLVIVLGLFLYLIFLGFFALRQAASRVFFVWLTVPLLLASLISLFSPMLGYWRFIYLLPAFVGLLTVGLSSLPEPARTFNFAILLILFALGNLYFWATPAFQREDWRGLSRLLNEPKTLTLVSFPEPFAPMKFYSPRAQIFSLQDRLKVKRNWDALLPPALEGKRDLYVLEYLMDLTDPKREILVWLKQAGLKPEAVLEFNGLGQIYRYQLN